MDADLLDLTGPQTAWAAAMEPFAGMRGPSTLPILQTVLLQYLPEDAAPSLVRTDRERQVRVTLPTDRFQVRGRGELAIDARKLADLIKSLPNQADLRLHQGASRVTLTATQQGRRLAQFTLNYLPGTDYPLMAAPGPLSLAPVTAEDEASQTAARFQLTLPGQRLAAALARVAFAMAKQDVRYYLNGVHLEWTGASLLLVATDGHRLADSGIQASVRGGYGQAILPAETVAMLARLGQEAGDAELVLTLSPRLLRVEQGGVELISKLIDGKYPDWRRVVPAGPATTSWTLPVEDLKRALLRVSVLCHEKFRGVKFHVPEHDRTALVLSAVNEDKEDAEETLPLATPSQQPMTIGFNLDYVMSVLGACPTETITWELTSGSASAKLMPGTTIADETQDDPEWVVMPMLL